MVKLCSNPCRVLTDYCSQNMAEQQEMTNVTRLRAALRDDARRGEEEHPHALEMLQEIGKRWGRKGP